ncbi:MAG: hypothetical protein A2474_05580 [Elusimicrobia bacterium RIFOXYC2_FULL_34_12]|nr:MAG: hypothetical protein A2474_05580 [Elusimicrobia bacterium RIFOXYC2_FULL_34_12]OGS39206.1 MAG: hypothetical protein A2551_06850 [Elusimicrobia bacterium RIFOXYD2_FULL_34_30]HAM39289.1 hypothetical protein [Elusimicrobiota bacterium]
MKFDKNYFEKQNYTEYTLSKYLKSGKHCLDIARKNSELEIRFHFVYMAFLKIGLYYIAKEGYRVKSRPGHHKIIIETLSNILGDENIAIIGDKIRKDRNLDLYASDEKITQKEVDEYFSFVEYIFKRLNNKL